MRVLRMRYGSLGRSGLQVSKLCLGTMNFGPQTDRESSCEILDAALEAGINFIDTANVYGRSAGRGATEKILGHWFSQGGGRREKVVLATKVYGRMGDGPNQGRLSARHIRFACEASLKRLNTDHIDLYQMHHIDRQTPWDEIWQAMEQLVREGKVLYVGSSNFAGWHIAKANEAAKRRNFFGLVSEQSLYNLNARDIELEVIPACQDYGLGLLPWSPLGAGVLAGALEKKNEGRRASDFVRSRVEKFRSRLEPFEALCRELGQSPAVVATAWVMHNPAVTAPIVGPRTMNQLNDAISAAELTLSEEVLTRLDELFPGPGGEAPEAYAW